MSVTLEAEPVSPGEALSGKLSGKSYNWRDVKITWQKFFRQLIYYINSQLNLS